MKPFFAIHYFFLLFFFSSCKNETPPEVIEEKTISPIGPFFGLEADTLPKLLLPDFISTRFGEYNGTFSPDGTEFYYTLSLIGYDAVVYTKMLANQTWSKPAIAPFSGKHIDYDPLFSPDGQRLFFSSHRPANDNQPKETSTIWYVKREGTSWGSPQYLPLKGPAFGNYFSSITKEGTIYFNIWFTGNMFKAQRTEGGYQVEQLSDGLNSEQSDGDPFIAADESYLIFRSYRPGGLGNGDLYISYNIDDNWTTPQNLGAPINSEAREMCPFVTTNGELFIFASRRMQSYYDEPPSNLKEVAAKYDSYDNGQTNIYYMRADFIEEMRPIATQETN